MIQTSERQTGAPAPSVLGFRLFAGDRRALIETLVRAARECRRPYRVDYLNAAQFNLACGSQEFAGRLRAMDLLYADGQSVVWAARREGEALPERLSAGDFIGEFLQRATSAGLSLALVGGTPGAAARFGEYWQRRVPGLEIRYTSDGFFDAGEAGAVCAAIEESDADVVLVGMGAPRQEAFVERAAGLGRARAWWCVGALFEYGPGGRRRAPHWMRRAGLEWAFRLAQEPRRLVGRYLIGNPLFVWRVMLRKQGSPLRE
jgi:N-acetylglucosaminyldiphosphoundecaprenol N-acetyl-beta-D-mannosaminyltransferase